MDEHARIASIIAKHKNILLRMSLRITIYYAVLAAVVALAVSFVPNFADQLPESDFILARNGGRRSYEPGDPPV